MDNYKKEGSKKQIIQGVLVGLFIVGIFFLALHFSQRNKAERGSYAPSQKETRPKTIQKEIDLIPSRVIDLSSWKLTVPLVEGGGSSEAMDIFQPKLASFQDNSWFFLSSDKKGVVFRAPVNAPTTKNSNYPRSELREMTSDGKEEIFWPTTSGTHSLFLDEAITSVPKNKPDVVAGQIHGDDDDLIVVRLEDKKLFLARGKSDLATLDENYVLGRRFTVKFIAGDGKISVFYNGASTPVYVLEKEVDEAYFKAGVYTQSNCETEDSPDLCSPDNYGEVIIYKIEVNHDEN